MGGHGARMTPVHALQAGELAQIGHGLRTAEQPHRAIAARLPGALYLRFAQYRREPLVGTDKIHLRARSPPLAGDPVTA